MREIRGSLTGAGLRIGLVAARFNEHVTEALLEGALDCLREHGVPEDGIVVVRVPGAWELPGAARRLAESGTVDGVVAIGCVIRGETAHFDYVAGEACRGLGALNAEGPIPIGLGVLTTETLEQALVRAGGKGENRGWDAAHATLEMAGVFRALRELPGGGT